MLTAPVWLIALIVAALSPALVRALAFAIEWKRRQYTERILARALAEGRKSRGPSAASSDPHASASN